MKWSALTKEAREKFLSTYTDDGYSANSVLADYKQDEELKAKGFDMEDIFYSGFHCQGDGACWRGRVDLKKYIMHHWLAPDVAVKREVMLALLDNDDMTQYLSIRTQGHYSHSGTMQVNNGIEVYFSKATLIDSPECRDSIFFGACSEDILAAIGGEAFLEEVEDEILDAAKELADTIYKALEAEYEYQHSEECVSELAEASDWDFTEEGEME